MNQSRIIKNYQILSKLRVLNTCQNPNPGDTKQEINLFSPDICPSQARYYLQH